MISVAIARPAVAGFRVLALALIVAASVVALTRISLAAPPPPPPVFSWTGFYIGGNFGYGVGHGRTVDNANPPYAASNLSPAGMIGGGQAGYRFQYNWLVVGAEADFQWSGQNNSLCGFYVIAAGCMPVFDDFRSSRLDWFGTVRGVVGVAQDNWLWYITGGYAYGSVVDQAGGFELGNGQVGFGSDRVIMHGWAIGTGVETRLRASNWSVKLEYLYFDLGHHKFDSQCAGTVDVAGTRLGCDTPPAIVAPPVDTSFTDHVVRIGLNYNIGGSQPAATPAPRPATVPANWAGFYVGGNVGYGVGHDHLQADRTKFNGTIDEFSLPQSPAGIVGGGQAGYRFQRDWLVIGAEADFQWSGQKDSSCVDTCAIPGVGLFYDEKLDWFGTVRGVAGVAQNDWLWYVTGGYAYGRIAVNVSTPFTGYSVPRYGLSSPILASSRSIKGGWTVGAGIETRLGGSNWSAKLEYLYMDLGDVSYDGYCTTATANLLGLKKGRCEALNSSITDHIVRVGLNYRFGA